MQLLEEEVLSPKLLLEQGLVFLAMHVFRLSLMSNVVIPVTRSGPVGEGR